MPALKMVGVVFMTGGTLSVLSFLVTAVLDDKE